MDPKKNMSEYKVALYRCVDWLEMLEDGELVMEEMRNDYSRGTMAMHKPLFKIGSTTS